MKQITLQITTRNRLADLKESLRLNEAFIKDVRVHTILCVDGSEDDTYTYIQLHYPEIELIHNSKSIGLIASRNRMMALTKTAYSVSFDDDAHFLSKNNADNIVSYFESHPDCAVMAFRIYWGKEPIEFIHDAEIPMRVRGFVGCGHAWRMAHWNQIMSYPEWFVFYGEEEFAGYELFKKEFEIHYAPSVFIQHRVDIHARKNQNDYFTRNRRAIRAGWYLWLLFIPIKYIPKYWIYSTYKQIAKFDISVFFALIAALIDCLLNAGKIIRNSNRLTKVEYQTYLALIPAKIYWKKNEYIRK